MPKYENIWARAGPIMDKFHATGHTTLIICDINLYGSNYDITIFVKNVYCSDKIEHKMFTVPSHYVTEEHSIQGNFLQPP